MNLESQRLTYLKFTEDQYDNYVKWYTDADVMKYITGRPLTLEEAKVRFDKALLNNKEHEGMGLYAISHKQSERFAGIAKFALLEAGQAEVGYGFLTDFWGQGYASEVLECLVNHAKKLNDIRELVGIVNKENLASKKVLTKKGFEYFKEEEEKGQTSEYYRLFLNEIDLNSVGKKTQ